MTQLNGIDTTELHEYIESAVRDPRVIDRDPVVLAQWVGGGGAKLTFPAGDAPVLVGGEAPSAMKLLLGTLAACDIEVLATRAALLGLEIESLTVEATGHFNVGRLLGLDSLGGPGYEQITYEIRVKTHGGTAAQLEELRRACEQASPVGDTLQRPVPLKLRFEGH